MTVTWTYNPIVNVFLILRKSISQVFSKNIILKNIAKFHKKTPVSEYLSNKFAGRNSCPEVFWKKSILRNFAKFTGKHLCQSLDKDISNEFDDIFKNTFFDRTPPVAASSNSQQIYLKKAPPQRIIRCFSAFYQNN